MAKFIEEFYYGNLDPQARSTKQNKTVQKQMEVLMLNEDFLTENLSGDAKKKFLDFCNAWGVVNGESNLDSFIMGFRLGTTLKGWRFRFDLFKQFIIDLSPCFITPDYVKTVKSSLKNSIGGNIGFSNLVHNVLVLIKPILVANLS